MTKTVTPRAAFAMRSAALLMLGAVALAVCGGAANGASLALGPVSEPAASTEPAEPTDDELDTPWGPIDVDDPDDPGLTDCLESPSCLDRLDALLAQDAADQGQVAVEPGPEMNPSPPGDEQARVPAVTPTVRPTGRPTVPGRLAAPKAEPFEQPDGRLVDPMDENEENGATASQQDVPEDRSSTEEPLTLDDEAALRWLLQSAEDDPELLDLLLQVLATVEFDDVTADEWALALQSGELDDELISLLSDFEVDANGDLAVPEARLADASGDLGFPGQAASASIFTDTRPVGPRLSAVVDVRPGARPQGAKVVVLGEGLAPGSPVRATLFSQPQEIGMVTADGRGLAVLESAIPAGLDPGQHVVDVRATAADGSAIQSIGAFTLDEDGIVAAVAPMGQMLEPIAVGDPTLDRALQSGARVFDPDRYPAITVSAAVLGVAIAGLVGVGSLASVVTSLPGGQPSHGGSTGDPTPNSPAPAGPGRRAKLAGSKATPLRRRRAEELGWGDRSRTWRWPGSAAIDAAIARTAVAASRVTSMGSRILTDGTWARAMFGPAGLALWVAGAALGFVAAGSVGFGIFPPAAPLLLAIVVVGILDAAAGLAAWSVLAVGALLTGQLAGWDGIRTLLGLFALYVVVPIVANELRPLRRSVSTSNRERFDRLADYVAMPVIIAWAGSSMYLALNGLSGLQLVDDDLVVPLRWALGLALLARLALEDLATRGYPMRIEATQPPIDQRRSAPVVVLSISLRVAIFVIVAAPFVGLGTITFVAAGLTAVPMVLREVQDNVRNFPLLRRYFPRGMALKLLLMVTGLYLAAWLLGPTVTDDRAREMFNWLLLPGIVAGVVKAFARTGGDWPDGWLKRWAGTVVWVVLAGLTVGVLTVPLP